MVSSYGINYAVHLVNNHFGGLVSKVCECLLKNGPLAFEEIERFVGLKAEKVQISLLVLIQHNCVQAFNQELAGSFFDLVQVVSFCCLIMYLIRFLSYVCAGDLTDNAATSKVVTKYFALFSHIIHRGRFEKFLEIVKQDFNPQCYDLMEGLFQHGRLSLEQIRARCGQLSVSKDADSALENLKKLVTSRYVERCPKPEPSVDPPQDEEPPKKKQRGASKSVEVVTAPETLEQRAIEAATFIDAVRFSIPSDQDTDMNGEKGEDELNFGRGTEQKVVLWRPNFEEFTLRLKLKACIDTVKEWTDDKSLLVFIAMLESCKSRDGKMNTKRSAPLSLEMIYESVLKSAPDQLITIDLVRDMLLELCSPFEFIIIDEDSYIIDVERIIDVAQNSAVESIVFRRYGSDAYRMFRFLSKARRLTETDKISDAALVEKKDAAKHLYKMWQDGYLHMERIVAGAQFLLWKVERALLWAHVLDNMFHSALNLCLRLKHENEQAQEVMSMDNKNKLRKMQLLLYSSLVKVDDIIMLFHHF